MSQEWTIPLTIRVSLGTPTAGASAGEATSAASIAALTTPAAAAAARSGVEGTEEAARSVSQHYIDKFSLASLAKKDFTWRTALSLALGARLAYSAKQDVETVAKSVWKFSFCEFVEADDTQCFVAATEGAVLVSFRGTENLGDWLSNLNTVSTGRSYGSVHRGFLGAFQVVQSQVETILRRFPGRPLALSGHSLGGALALVAAAEWERRFPITCVHTFGQPATGKDNFRDFINRTFPKSYHRFVNDDDVVPRVPPWFAHCGNLIHFDKRGGLEDALGAAEREKLGLVPVPLEDDTPVMSEVEFDLLRARLLQEKAAQGGAPLSEESVQHAAAEMAGQEGLEGIFPSVSDHSMEIYVKKIAVQAGF